MSKFTTSGVTYSAGEALGFVFFVQRLSLCLAYIERLKQLQTEFEKQGFTLVGINANYANRYHEQSLKNMKDFALQSQLNFPYLWDATQDVAHSFGANKDTGNLSGRSARNSALSWRN
jgi:alkyl hydroperoxide reductase subunit AhpC